MPIAGDKLPQHVSPAAALLLESPPWLTAVAASLASGGSG